MNILKFYLYNYIDPKPTNISLIASYIIKNNITNLPKKLCINSLLLKELLNRINDGLDIPASNDFIFKTNIEKSLYYDNIDDVTNYIIKNNIHVDNIPNIDNDLLASLVINIIYMNNYDLVFDALCKNKELYEKIDKYDIIKMLREYEKAYDIPFIKDDKALFLEGISYYNSNVVFKINYNENVLADVDIEEIISILKRDLYLPVSDSILKKICEDKNNVIDMLESHSYNESVIKYIINNLDDDLINTILELNNTGLYINPKVLNSIDINVVADYIIKNEITHLSFYNDSRKLFDALVSKKYEYILSVNFDSELLFDKADILHDIFINKDYESKNNNSLEKCMISDNVKDVLFYDNSPLSEADIKKIVSYIIATKDYKLLNDVGLNNNDYVFNTLFDRLNIDILSIPFSDRLIENNKERLFDLFINGNPPVGFEFDKSMNKAIFSNPRILDEKNTKKVADYIINCSYLSSIYLAANSKQLFMELINRDYNLLFSRNFSADVIKSVPIEILRNYYAKHPRDIYLNVDRELKLNIMGLNCQEIEYTKLKPLILYDERKKAEIGLTEFDNFSQALCFDLNSKSLIDVLNKYRKQLDMIKEEMEISEDDLTNLFDNYQKNNGMYLDKIIDLVRKFIAKRKERIALYATELKLEEIKYNYSSISYNEIMTEIKKQKRKVLYLKQLKTKDISDIMSLIIKLNDKYYMDNPYKLIEMILNGNQIYDLSIIQEKIKKNNILKRLQGTYTKEFNRIIESNIKYKGIIINYINGQVSYEEINKIIEKDNLKILRDLKVLFDQLEVKLIDNENGIEFSGNYDLTSEETELFKIYEIRQKVINNIRKKIFADMKSNFPMESIPFIDEDYQIYSSQFSKSKYYFDINKLSDAGYSKIFNFLLREIVNSEDRELLLKLFADSYFIYSFPFISHEIIEDMEFVAKNIKLIKQNFDMSKISIDNLDRVIRSAKLYMYTKPSDRAILGEDTALKIAFNNKFITLDNHQIDGQRERVAKAAKYISLAGKHMKSTIPYVRADTGDMIAERYDNDDPNILLAGIDTDACFRVNGVDNDFLLYTMFNKNGIVVRFKDKSGKFIGRMSGFRNGNILFFNQLRSIYDSSGSPTKEINDQIELMRTCAEEYARKVIEETKKSEYPIEHVVILAAYGYNNCDYLQHVDREDIRSKYSDSQPMSVSYHDYYEYKNNSELLLTSKDSKFGFTTDFSSGYDLLLMASSSELGITSPDDVKKYDPSPIYDKPRKKPEFYTLEKTNLSVINAVNAIRAKGIYWGNSEEREQRINNFESITKLDNLSAIVIGQDFYISIDKEGNVSEFCLPYDDRAIDELNNCKMMLLTEYEKSKTK